MADIREHMKIIGKDGAHVGTVDRVEGNRIKLTRKDSPEGHKNITTISTRNMSVPSRAMWSSFQ
jgi:hypothetical protein